MYGDKYRAATYLELELYSLAQRQATLSGTTLSKWLRQLVFEDLLKRGSIPKETLVRLASG